MKNLLLLLSITWLLMYSPTACTAQKAAKSNLLTQFVSMMDTSEAPSSWKIVSDQFEKLSETEANNWLVLYHTSFSHAIYAMRINDMKEREKYLDLALTYAEKADAVKPNESEIYVLRGMITAMKITIDPSTAMELGQESSMLMNKGKQLNSENPRAYLELGESAMYIPEQYGGGKKKSQALLETSIAKYKTFKPTEANWPHWGEARAKNMLEKCNSL